MSIKLYGAHAALLRFTRTAFKASPWCLQTKRIHLIVVSIEIEIILNSLVALKNAT